MPISVTYIKPDYYEGFSCIGSNCRHNCCDYNWYISIDKQTFKKYRNFSGSKELQNLFKTYIIPNQNPTAANYAHIKHLENPSRCPFIDNHSLCLIHKELGHVSLSNTCKVYPRIFNSFISKTTNNRYIEKSLNCGCEAVVQLFLNNKDMMLLNTELAQLTENQLYANFRHVTNKLDEQERAVFIDYYFIRSICIAILQNRELSFEDRLILLGFYLNKINHLEQSGQEESICNESDQFVNSLDEKAFAKIFQDINSDYHRQLLISGLMYKFFKSDTESYFAYIEEKIEHNLQVDNATVTPDEKANLLVEKYKKYSSNYYNFMSDKGHFIENLFTNELFRQGIPFKPTLNLYENFQYITTMFITYRYLVAFYMGENETITDAELIDITTYCGRTFLNDARDPKHIIEFLGDDFKNLAEMALLIK